MLLHCIYCSLPPSHQYVHGCLCSLLRLIFLRDMYVVANGIADWVSVLFVAGCSFCSLPMCKPLQDPNKISISDLMFIWHAKSILKGYMKWIFSLYVRSSCRQLLINPVWHSYAYDHRGHSWFVWWCITCMYSAPIHYLNRWWHIIDNIPEGPIEITLRNSSQNYCLRLRCCTCPGKRCHVTINTCENLGWNYIIGSGNGFVTSSNTPLSEPCWPRFMSPYGVIRHQRVNSSWYLKHTSVSRQGLLHLKLAFGANLHHFLIWFFVLELCIVTGLIHIEND